MNLNVAGETMVRTNAASTPVQVSRLALFVAASVEGHTVFVGYRKPWRAETGPMLDLALQPFPRLIEHGRVPGAAR